MNICTLFSSICFLVGGICSGKDTDAGFAWFNGELVVYKISNNGIRSAESMDRLIKVSMTEACIALGCAKSEVRFTKIESRNDNDQWFNVSFEVYQIIGIPFELGSKPIVKKSVVIPIRRDAQLGARHYVGNNFDASSSSRFIDWLKN